MRRGNRQIDLRLSDARVVHILLHMNVLIDLDPETYRRLERVAPARSRKRSAFIRAAIQKALWDLEEERTRQAYLDTPDEAPAPVDPATWEPLPYGGFDPPSFEETRSAPERTAVRPRRSPGPPRKSAKTTAAKRSRATRK
jgi:hypothetical protein